MEAETIIDTPVTEETPTEEAPQTEETPAEETTIPVTETVDYSAIDTALQDILNEFKIPEATPIEEEKPTEPKFFVEKEEDKAKEEEEVNQVIEELVTLNEQIQSALDEKEAKTTELESQIASLTTLVDESKNEKTTLEATIEAMENAWTKISSHPILWQMNVAIAKGEEIDIPAFIEQFVQEKKSAFPNFEWEKTVSAPAPQVSKLQAIRERPSL